MFFYATSNRFKHNLALHNLGETVPFNQSWLEQAAKWGEEKWGYLRNFPGLDKRKELIEEMKNDFYIITYANQPVAMFALKDSEFKNAKKLNYVYVDESFRGLGIGVQLIEFAKKVCKEKNAHMIILDTLTPNLDRFYEKRGAEPVCEVSVLGHPASLFKMRV